MSRHGVDIINVLALFSGVVFFLINTMYSAGYIFKPHHLSAHTLIENLRLTGISFLRLHGLDVLATAQHRMAKEENKKVEKGADLAIFRKKLVSKTVLECYTLHFLFGTIPVWISSASTIVYAVQRSDWWVVGLTIGSVWSKTLVVLTLAHCAFVVRLSQKMSELECRRVEADIRTVFPSLTHRITPRFKSLLHEVHMTGNRCHAMYFFVLPVVVLNALMVVCAVTVASFGTGGCVPTWCFFSVFQPVITVITWVHFSGVVNVAIERDIDQDVVEMNIRLTFSNTHVPNWLLQQMICIERLDGRALSLPGGIPASVEMGRHMLSSLITVCIVLGPYLISIWDKLSSQVLCE